MLEMLPILDNLQRAVAAASDRAFEPSSMSVTEGVRATVAMLVTALQRFGVRKRETVGAAFDPSLHDALMEQDPSSEPPGTIIGVIEDGYTIGDRPKIAHRYDLGGGGATNCFGERYPAIVREKIRLTDEASHAVRL